MADWLSYKNEACIFRLNGHCYSKQELTTLATNIIRSESAPGWQKKIYLFILEWLDEQPSIESMTSGSTGPPKRILLDKMNMVESARRTGRYLNLKASESALLCLPIDFIAGKMMVVRAFVLGLDLHYVNPTSNPLVDVQRGFDFTAMTPMQVFSILETTDGQQRLESISNLIIGGGVLDEALRDRISRLGNACYQTYGMTETITHIAMRKLNGQHPMEEYEVLDGVSIFSDEHKCLVLDDALLGLKGLKTFDLVEITANDRFKFLGRHDNIINSGGIKIIPELLENKLKARIRNRLVVAGEPNERLGEQVIVFVEQGRMGIPADLEAQIDAAIENPYHKPKRVVVVERFPETSHGKILRKRLLEEHLTNS